MRKKRGLFVLLLGVFLLLILPGCGVKVSNKSPEAVVKSLANAYQAEEEEAILKCMGIESAKNLDDTIKQEINYNSKLFQAHGAKEIQIRQAEVIGEFEKKDLVYIWFTYEIEEKKETLQAPSLAFYFVNKKDEKYYVVPAKDVTDEMSEYSRKKYAQFTKTEEYKQYQKEYKEFIRKNPKYETKLEENFKELNP